MIKIANLIYLILAAFVSAPIVYILGRNIGNKVSWLVFAVLLGITIYLALQFPTVQHEVILEEYSWVSPPVNLSFGFMGDGLSVPMLFTYLFVFSGATRARSK